MCAILFNFFCFQITFYLFPTKIKTKLFRFVVLSQDAQVEPGWTQQSIGQRMGHPLCFNYLTL